MTAYASNLSIVAESGNFCDGMYWSGCWLGSVHTEVPASVSSLLIQCKLLCTGDDSHVTVQR